MLTSTFRYDTGEVENRLYFHTTAQETMKYATFRYDTIEVENWLN